MKNRYRVRLQAGIFSLLAAAGSLTGCTATQNGSTMVDTRRYEDVDFQSESVESETICENDGWRLLWDDAKKRVSFEDKATGTVWGPVPSEAYETVYNEDGIALKNHPQVESAVLVYYHNPATQEEKAALSYTDAVDLDGVYTEVIDGGLRVTYDFIDLEISVPVEYTIEDDRFLITVYPEEIADNGEYYVTAVALAPYLCGVRNNREDAWLFLPDGSGALVAPTEQGTVGTIGSADVYGGDLTVQDYYFLSTTQQLNMPVYGAKKGDAALLTVIDSGAESASLAWNIGSSNIRYSSIYPVFHIRGYSLIEAPQGFSSPLTEIKVFAKSISTVPLRIAGYSLSGESADVAGMASIYQDYLIRYKGLAAQSGEEAGAAFKLVGAIEQPRFLLGVPYTDLYSLTTTDDVARITRELVDELGTNFLLDLVGFGSSGVNIGQLAGGFTVADKLGGQSGINALAGILDGYGLDWYMDFDLAAFTKSSSSFTRSADSSTLPNGQAAWFSGFNTVTREQNSDRFYLLAHDRLIDAAETLVQKAGLLGLSGVSLDSLSHTVYADYSSADVGAGAGMAEDAVKAFQTVRQSGLQVLTDASNDYAAVQADAIVDAPLYSSGYDFTFADVPFYELVFKGFVPISSVSINLCADKEDALLRCVEAGIAPSYTLVANYDSALITSTYSFLFASGYDGIKETAFDGIRSLSAYLKSVKGAAVAGYSLQGDVRITQFDNGVYAVVNYGDTPTDTEYGTVPGHSFITGKEAS